jgi:nucleotide-binding universal stress UspA family protein
MLTVRRILVPTDFSAPSHAALDMAIELGRRFGAELTLMHAHQVPAYLYPEGMMPLSADIVADLERSIIAELGRLAARASAAGVAATTCHSIGVAVDEIVRAAAELPADLIVMGTHGRTGIRHALLGSVAEKVVRRAPCPVLTVRPGVQSEAHP